MQVLQYSFKAHR